MLQIHYSIKGYLKFLVGVLSLMVTLDVYFFSLQKHPVDVEIYAGKLSPVQIFGRWKTTTGGSINMKPPFANMQSSLKKAQLSPKLHQPINSFGSASNMTVVTALEHIIIPIQRPKDSYKRLQLENIYPGNHTNSVEQSWFGEDAANLSSFMKISKIDHLKKGRNGSIEHATFIKLVLDIAPKDVEKVVHSAVKWFLLDASSTKDELLNNHNFVYHLNSKLCVRTKTQVLIIVHSALGNYKKRQRIRNAWGSIKRHQNASVVTVFMLGEHKISNINLQGKIKRESDQFGDIVQGNFIDSYKNLTYKNIMDLHWITSQCSHVKTIAKVDDDVFVDVYKLVEFSINTGHFDNSLYCRFMEMEKPKRYGKWRIFVKDFPFPVYPTYCEGMAYIMSIDEAQKLSKASEDMRFFWIDDVFVTGFLALRAGLGHVKFKHGHLAVKKHWVKQESTAGIDKFMFFTDFNDWNALLKKSQLYHNIAATHNSTSISNQKRKVHT